MTQPNFQDPSVIKDIIKNSKTIAVIGISTKPHRPSYGVASYLQSAGYRIIPVNPAHEEILSEKCYPDLISIPENVDVVDIFWKPEMVMTIVESSIKIGAKAIWFQEGVVNAEAAKVAHDAGLKVVMDRCLLKEHRRLM